MSVFGRFCEVTIGPLADWQGRGNAGEAIVIRADGTNARLRIAFQSTRSLTGEPNKTEVIIYGLGRDLRGAMRAALTRVQLVAGYESDGRTASVVTIGAISAAATARQGGDVVTRLTVLDGMGGMVRGAVSRSYKGGTSLEQVIRETAQGMPGVTVGAVAVPGTLPKKGVTLAGPSVVALNKLADQYGFSWSVQSGVFQAIMDAKDNGTVYVASSDSNLLSLTPALSGPTPGAGGVDIGLLFDARIKPGDRVSVQSTVNPQLSGQYKALAVNSTFDSHGPAGTAVQAVNIVPVFAGRMSTQTP